MCLFFDIAPIAPTNEFVGFPGFMSIFLCRQYVNVNFDVDEVDYYVREHDKHCGKSYDSSNTSASGVSSVEDVFEASDHIHDEKRIDFYVFFIRIRIGLH